MNSNADWTKLIGNQQDEDDLKQLEGFIIYVCNQKITMGRIPNKVKSRVLRKSLKKALLSGDLERVEELNGKLNTLKKPKKLKKTTIIAKPKIKAKYKRAIMISTPMGGQPRKR